MNSVVILTHGVNFPLEKHRRLEFGNRILFISNYFPKVILISTDERIKKHQIEYEVERKRGITLIKIPDTRIVAALQCSRLLKQIKPSLVICDTTSDAHRAIIPKIFQNFPMLVTTIAFDTDLYLSATRLRKLRKSRLRRLVKGLLHVYDVFIFNLSDKIVCVSPAFYHHISNFLSKKSSRSKIKFVRNSYYHTKNVPQEFKSNMQQKLEGILNRFEKKQHILIYAGNLSYNKRPDIVIAALKILIKKIKNVLLLIIGNGSMEPILRKYSQQLKISDRVFFLGRLKQFETIAMISKSDALVFPSLSEGFSNVISEAMAVGTPVVAYAQKSVSALCKNREVGLIQDENPRNYAAELYKIIEDTSYRDMVIKNSFILIEPFVNNTPEKRYTRLLEEYKDIIIQSQAGPFKTALNLFLKWIKVFLKSLIQDE